MTFDDPTAYARPWTIGVDVQLFPDTELLENVWEMSHSPTTRTVDNFIVNLRKYFEVDPAEPRHFLSVRGTGYRFVAAGDSSVAE